MLRSLCFGSLLGAATAQLYYGVPGLTARDSRFNGSHFCNSTFADANSTGAYSFNPDVGSTSDNVTYFGSVYKTPPGASNNITELSLWISPNGANWTDNFSLGYDVCYLWLQQLSLNSFERGQHPDSNFTCLQTFDETCVNDFLSLTNQYTTELVNVPSPGPNSNLTTNSLPDVCTDLATMLTQNFPESCKVYFNDTQPIAVYGGAPALGGALTGPQSIISRSQCKTSNGYSLLWTQYGDATTFNYDFANYFIAPIITAFMPIADVARPISLSYTKSFLNCFKVTTVNPGSEEVPPAPTPTAVINPYENASNSSSNSTSSNSTNPSNTAANDPSSGGGLSAGAIAGIVVGIVLGLALLGGLVWFFVLRKKRSRGGEVPPEMSGNRRSRVEAPHGSVVSEMEGKGPRSELLATQAGESTAPAELPVHQRRYELDGS